MGIFDIALARKKWSEHVPVRLIVTIGPFGEIWRLAGNSLRLNHGADGRGSRAGVGKASKKTPATEVIARMRLGKPARELFGTLSLRQDRARTVKRLQRFIEDGQMARRQRFQGVLEIGHDLLCVFKESK